MLDYLYKKLALSESDAEKQELNLLIDNLEIGLIAVEEAIQAAKMIGVRNPAFDGDLVGWLDDDFDEEEEDSDD